MSRLALGTAQFGLRYGVANRAGQVDPQSVSSILARAISGGVDTLDTAVAYGESETVLGRTGVAGWKVVTKLPPLPDGVPDVAEWIDVQVRGSAARLGVSQFDALLLHRPADLLGAHGPAYRASLAGIRARGVTRAVGVSIYHPGELDALWASFKPDLVQAPLNVIDRRLLTSGWLERLAEHGVRVHVRSVFLQGLLLMSATARPGYFAPWNGLLDRWLAWCSRHAVSPQGAALAFVHAQSGVERYVVGVDSLQQLEDLLAVTSLPGELPPADLASEDPALVDPSRWKLQ